MRRREFVIGSASLAGLSALHGLYAAHATNRSADASWKEFAPANIDLIEPLPALDIDKAVWRQRLPQSAYEVLFEEQTERPHSSALDTEKRAGLFLCAACELPLFSSAMKYESGTGWPSFFDSIPGHLATKLDFKLIWPRTEYHCVKCGGHQGHVFEDGPQPTGQRWCNNGVALKFVPRDTG